MSKEELSKEELQAKVHKIKQAAWPKPAPIPRCCATCLYLNELGHCTVFNDTPPLAYLSKENDCPKYELDVPF